MSGSSIDIVVDDKEVNEYLQKLQEKMGDLKVPLADIGEYLLLSHEERWDKQVSPDGEAWLPLSAGYLARKPQNKDKILVLYGHLRQLQYQATSNSLTLGTDKVYAATQQFGDPSRNIPARPFLGISQGDEENIIGILKQYFTL